MASDWSVTLSAHRYLDYLLAIETEYALREFATGKPATYPEFSFRAASDPSIDLSIVMPTWRPQRHHLTRALGSVIGQRFGELSWELVVAEDGDSNDVASELLSQLDRPNVRYLRQPKRLGGLANFNQVVAESRGRWIHMLHQDDFIEPNFFEGLLGGDASNGEIGMRFCRVRLLDEDAGQIRLMFDEGVPRGVFTDFLARQTVCQRVQFAGAIFSRRAVEAVGCFDPTIGAACDWDFWARLGSRFAVFYDPGQLATYVLHSKSWSSTDAHGYENADSFRKFRVLLQRMLGYVAPTRRHPTARGFLQNMFQRLLDLAGRNQRAGAVTSTRAAGQALLLGCQEAGVFADVEAALLGVCTAPVAGPSR
jgi:hypothetical protein